MSTAGYIGLILNYFFDHFVLDLCFEEFRKLGFDLLQVFKIVNLNRYYWFLVWWAYLGMCFYVFIDEVLVRMVL